MPTEVRIPEITIGYDMYRDSFTGSSIFSSFFFFSFSNRYRSPFLLIFVILVDLLFLAYAAVFFVLNVHV